MTRSATWRLQNQWLGGLRWREFASEETFGENSAAPQQDSSGMDIAGSLEAAKALDRRLAELEVVAGCEVSAKHGASCSRSPHEENRLLQTPTASEAHVAGVKRARLQAFQECFDELISRFRLYSPLLSRVKREFDALIDAFEACIDDVTARKVDPAAMQTEALKTLISSSDKLVADLQVQIHKLEREAEHREGRVKKLTQENNEMKTMVSTRQIQSRRSDQDFIKQSMRNDTLTMRILELQVRHRGNICMKILESVY